MKRKQWSFLTALVLLTGFTACSTDENGNTPDEPKEMTTYMSLTLRLPKQANLRAGDDNNYNAAGIYTGVTAINTVDIYLTSTDGTTMLETRRLEYEKGDYTFQADASGYDHIDLTKPFKTAPGSKKMIVVINCPLPSLTAAPADDYRYVLSSSLPLSSLARIDPNRSAQIGNVTVYADVVVLSGKSSVINIEDGVSETEVIASRKNIINVDVARVPSRVIVTSSAPSTVVDINGTSLGTISDVTYSVAQGANSVYLFAQANADSSTKTWGYDYFPGPGTDYGTTATTYYDYSDLLNQTDAVPSKPGTTGSYMYLPGKFFLENTHQNGVDLSSSRYRKGNTAYVLVRAKFTPDAAQIADGGALTNGTFYIGGINGKIYSSVTAAQNYLTGVGVQNQPVSTYPNGKVLYYIWLNPDNIQKPVNSPTIRNNIYHININTFKSIGVNWNPLIPSGPDAPRNPDPKPTGPEPENPTDPTDPLSSTDTYMSVDVMVLPWTVHTYDIDL
ncbi:Mfa1 family fimbria major subunit [Dysgonomonas sp. HGC4]|uniref:Mfa1 family fimbria major subunit n=1 Tax=Dysgonomonas sp. HGC4 TaxID=1658009 RepID=UPI0006811F41|nr:Mfa1 family fimbria major subunit [Dysgonomonas sp. HGC4]MBD8349947.1 Mfa1 fimbrilin C-terminal domain-containing protein [Dysgonomonas sp. HGC4]